MAFTLGTLFSKIVNKIIQRLTALNLQFDVLSPLTNINYTLS